MADARFHVWKQIGWFFVTLIWPFRTKVGTATGSVDDPTTQWRRIDQGQDAQGLGPTEEDVLAIASGTVTYAHDPADPANPGAHFGDPYPVLHFDSPVGGYPACYYGHTHPTVPEGVHVSQGDKVATTTSPGGGLAPNHWLELGFWVNGPACGGDGGWTQCGQTMHDLLVGAPVWNPPHPLPPIGPPTTKELLNVNVNEVNSAVNLDANGNGYADEAVIPDATKVMSVMFTAQDPPVGGYHRSPLPQRRQEGGITRLVFYGGEPNVQFGFTAYVLA